jgi:hypothetical protein
MGVKIGRKLLPLELRRLNILQIVLLSTPNFLAKSDALYDGFEISKCMKASTSLSDIFL